MESPLTLKLARCLTNFESSFFSPNPGPFSASPSRQGYCGSLPWMAGSGECVLPTGVLPNYMLGLCFFCIFRQCIALTFDRRTRKNKASKRFWHCGFGGDIPRNPWPPQSESSCHHVPRFPRQKTTCWQGERVASFHSMEHGAECNFVRVGDWPKRPVGCLSRGVRRRPWSGVHLLFPLGFRHRLFFVGGAAGESEISIVRVFILLLTPLSFIFLCGGAEQLQFSLRSMILCARGEVMQSRRG